MTLFLDTFSTGSVRTAPKVPLANNDDWWDGVRTGPVSSLSTYNQRCIELPRPPLLTVTSLSTFDEDDTETVYDASNYFVDTSSLTGRLVLKSSSSFPTDIREVNGIKITRHALRKFAREDRCKRRGIETDPSGKIRIEHLL